MSNSVLKVQNISFSYTQNEMVLDIPKLEIPLGRVSVFLGGNGSGKTTLFKLLSGLLEVEEGSITIEGVVGDNIPKEDSIYVHQTPYLLKGTVMQNIKLLLGDALGDYRSVSTFLDINAYKYAKVHELSGGERKKVALVCAILAEKSIMLFDEPTAHLDALSIENFEMIIKNLRNQGSSILIATHDVDFAYNCADYIWYMESGNPVPYSPKRRKQCLM